MNDKAVYRTTPAKPGLLNILEAEIAQMTSECFREQQHCLRQQ